MIDAHVKGDAPWCVDWQYLQVHAEYVKNLAEVLKLTQQGKYEEAKSAIAFMIDHINRNELFIQKVMDGNKSKMHWERRLDPKKCLSTDVM